MDIQYEADLDFGVDTVADINGDKDEVGSLGPQYRRSNGHLSAINKIFIQHLMHIHTDTKNEI